VPSRLDGTSDNHTRKPILALDDANPRPTAVTGVGVIASGPLLVAAGLTAIAAPWRAPRRAALSWRLARNLRRLIDIPARGKRRRCIIERGLSRMDELRAVVPPQGDLRPCLRPPCEETR
jgi:hypothetical protein